MLIFTMNAYEQKQERRREYYKALALRNHEKADAQYKKGIDALDQIPFGQPILVGHHSEKADRAHRSKAVANIDKSFETRGKAEYYENKAENMSTAISSDDPDALPKLKAKLAMLEAERERIKAHNVAMRKAGNRSAQEPSYVLKNLGKNIDTVKYRISFIEKVKARPERPDVVNEQVTMRENRKINRLQLIFKVKPNAEIISMLKSSGFRWSPSEGAWQAFISNRSEYKAGLIIAKMV